MCIEYEDILVLINLHSVHTFWCCFYHKNLSKPYPLLFQYSHIPYYEFYLNIFNIYTHNYPLKMHLKLNIHNFLPLLILR